MGRKKGKKVKPVKFQVNAEPQPVPPPEVEENENEEDGEENASESLLMMPVAEEEVDESRKRPADDDAAESNKGGTKKKKTDEVEIDLTSEATSEKKKKENPFPNLLSTLLAGRKAIAQLEKETEQLELEDDAVEIEENGGEEVIDISEDDNFEEQNGHADGEMDGSHLLRSAFTAPKTQGFIGKRPVPKPKAKPTSNLDDALTTFYNTLNSQMQESANKVSNGYPSWQASSAAAFTNYQNYRRAAQVHAASRPVESEQEAEKPESSYSKLWNMFDEVGDSVDRATEACSIPMASLTNPPNYEPYYTLQSEHSEVPGLSLAAISKNAYEIESVVTDLLMDMVDEVASGLGEIGFARKERHGTVTSIPTQTDEVSAPPGIERLYDKSDQFLLQPLIRPRSPDVVETQFMTTLESYWAKVKKNPDDFDTWTAMLNLVDVHNDVIPIREVFDAFLLKYPYCYGYWHKYAEIEKRFLNIRSAQEVYERGVTVIPLSVDLWLYYIHFLKSVWARDVYGGEHYVRALYERAIEAAGMDFKSDKLWESYIKFEAEKENFHKATHIYDRLLNIPVRLYSQHFDNFKVHVNSKMPKSVVSSDEFALIWQEFLLKSNENGNENAQHSLVQNLNSMPTTKDPDLLSVEDTVQLRQMIIDRRMEKFTAVEKLVKERWTFEEAVRRPYFHVKPIEKGQLKNWREYLDFEIESGDHERIVILFERCLISCCLYEEFWMKYVNYMMEKDPDAVTSIFQRVCHIHLPAKAHIRIAWSTFEECQGNDKEAWDIIEWYDKVFPGVAAIVLRKIALQRRMRNAGEVERLYRQVIDLSTNDQVQTQMVLKYARYLEYVLNRTKDAVELVQHTLEKYPTNPHLYILLIEYETKAGLSEPEKVIAIFDKALGSEMEAEGKAKISSRKLQFLEEFGLNVNELRQAYIDHQKLVREAEKLVRSERRKNRDKK